jgi:hypothetical protein
VSTAPDPTPSPSRPSFTSVFAQVADVEGWMSEAQARRLWDRAAELGPEDLVVEIGSFHGRSMIMLASAAPAGVELVAIDPHGGNDRGPQEISGFTEEAQADYEQFHANLERAGVHERVTHLRSFSSAALGEVRRPIQLLYIDGAHRFGPARDDIQRWGAKVTDGGTMLIHDSFSSVGVTLALLSSTFFGASFRYEGRSGSMTQYRRVHLGARERLRNAARQAASLPWFLRNVVIKLAIMAKLRPVYRALGSDGNWPY